MSSIANKIIRKTRFYYGWVIVAVMSLSFFFAGLGQSFSFSVFIDSYINDLGWNRSTVSGLFSAATLMAGMLLFLIGRLSDRLGPKRIIIVAAVMLGASCIWNSFITTQFMLLLGFFFGRLTGQGALALMPSTVIPRWFVKKRAFAFSITFLGSVIACAALPLLNTWLIGLWGWRDAWRLWGGLVLVLFIPLISVFIYDKPEQLGLAPYDNDVRNVNGCGNGNDIAAGTIPVAADDETPSWSLKEAIRTRSFWGILFCQMIIPMIGAGVLFHFVSIMGTKGIASGTAAFIMSLMAIAIFPATIIAGYMFDRLKLHLATALICILQTAGLALLLITDSITGAIVYAVIQGAVFGFQSINDGVVWPNYFGLRHIGSIRGFVMAGIVVASAIGPLPLGVAFDAFGGYTEALFIIMLFPAAGILAALMSPKPTTKPIHEPVSK